MTSRETEQPADHASPVYRIGDVPPGPAAAWAEGREPLSLEDARRLLHELQTRQVELTRQNEELRRACEATGTSRGPYQRLFDGPPVSCEESLRQSQAVMSVILHSTSEMFVYCDTDLRLVWANRAAGDSVGARAEDLVGQHCYRIWQGRETPCDGCPLMRVKETREPQHAEMATPDGRVFLIRGYPVFGSDGSLINLIEFGQDITERKRVEDQRGAALVQLQESQARLATLFEHSPVSIWEEDLSGVRAYLDHLQASGVSDLRAYFAAHPSEVVRCAGLVKVLDINETSVEMLGARSKQEIPYDLRTYLTETSVPVFADQFIALAEGRLQYTYEIPVRGLTGEERVMAADLAVIPGYEGSLSRVLVSFVDITERQHIEDALRQSESLLRKIFDILPVGLWLADKHGKLLSANAAGARIWGAEPYVGQREYGVFRARRLPSGEEIAPDDWALAHTVNEGVTVLDEMLEIDAFDGTKKTILNYTAPVLDEQGKVEAAVVVNLDVSELRRTEDELRESEARFRTIFEHTAVGIALTTPEGRFMRLNRRFCEITGYNEEDLLLRTFHEITHPLDLEVDRVQRQRMLDGEIQVYTTEKRYIHASGGFVWANLNVSLLRDAEGAPRYFISVAEDITERKRAEAHAAQLMADLRHSNAELEQFAYVASHDLQEPLRMVASFTQLLGMRYKGRLDADADDFIGYAVEGAQRMQHLIEDLLAFSRVGNSTRSFVPVDCSAVVAQVQASLGSAIAEAGASVRVDSLPTLTADQTQMQLLFENLLQNAIKFRSERAPQVHISALRSDGHWLFSVTDNGIGIDPAYHERIFVIFQRLHTRDRYPGTGIGLALAKKIVERHGGRIWVDSQTGSGATFHFTLPAEMQV
jgi:PAS domain S-box-containing protein